MKTKVVFLLGPTGVGKTGISIALAKAFDGEIISSDSVQIFKEFDIGSAKITKEEMQGVKHYGIDIISPLQEFSAYDYVQYTKEKIAEISAKGKLPIVVGGTGLYVRALTEGYNFGQAEKNAEFREKIEKEIEENGLESVYNKLCEIDKDLASKTDGKNKVRVIRALEIATFGTKKEKVNQSEFDCKIFALNMDRQKLYDKINQRVDIMVKDGVIEEAERLYKKYGLVQPMTAIGYKEFIPYFNNEMTKQECIDLVKQHTRNYAKRQLTFLRGMANVELIDAEDKSAALTNIIEQVNNFIN